jgi:diguanylate cyclase
MDWWNIQIPIPVAMAAIATIGYLISRRSRAATTDIVVRSRREMKRAQTVAVELEKIAWGIRQSLAKHHASVARFKQRVSQLNDQQQEAAWKELCHEAEDILRPTLQLATQIANAYDEIRQQSANLMTFTEVRTDPLTNVHNRRGLDDALNAQFALMTRYNSPFSIAMFDIDHFKQVNDQLGHLHGDRVLQELASLFDELVRETDVVARYGGEEFVVVMPHTDLAGASVFAERLRAEVERRLSVTISGGVSEAEQGDSQESLVARADTALYNAKSAGRNRVFWHTGDRTEQITVDPLMAAPQ